MSYQSPEPTYDPYDIWCTNLGVVVRRYFYRNSFAGKLGAVCLSLADWLTPNLIRSLCKSTPRQYPIAVAHYALCCDTTDSGESQGYLKLLQSMAVSAAGQPDCSWGLGFSWMSKNGLYPPDLPFVTHTPYVMEALLHLVHNERCSSNAMSLFNRTWLFLQSLHIMHEAQNELALSYAPVDEPRIVVNANAYAAFAYALHAVHGLPEHTEEARRRAIALARWVCKQQSDNGSWRYYADDEPGNFIDGFHSCFVVKNLIKTQKLIPELEHTLEEPIKKGFNFIRQYLYDDRKGLCRRFMTRSHLDPFHWDIYDQAEYLGLLIDFGHLDEARRLARKVESVFADNGHWFCRIDIFGRRWGKNFMRWGITPFLYQRNRLDLSGEKAAQTCVA